MNIPRLRLWEEAALRLGECDAGLWTARGRATSADAPDEADERRRIQDRSRRESHRTRAAALHGFILSALFGLPTGLVFGYSTLVASMDRSATQCVQVSSMLDAGLQRGLHQYRSLRGLSASEEALLGAEVCDPLLKSIIPSIVSGITSDLDARTLGRSMKTSPGQPEGWSMLRAVVGAGAQ